MRLLALLKNIPSSIGHELYGKTIKFEKTNYTFYKINNFENINPIWKLSNTKETGGGAGQQRILN